MERSKRGFTLIELLAVIAIIGILAGVVTISFASSRVKSRDAKRKSDVIAIWNVAQQYMTDNKYYFVGQVSPDYERRVAHCADYQPENLGISNYMDKTITKANWSNFEAEYTKYLANGTLPIDPLGRCKTGTKIAGSGSPSNYIIIFGTPDNPASNDQCVGLNCKLTRLSIWTQLENGNDPDINGNKPEFLYKNVESREWFFNISTTYDNNSPIKFLYAKGTPKI